MPLRGLASRVPVETVVRRSSRDREPANRQPLRYEAGHAPVSRGYLDGAGPSSYPPPAPVGPDRRVDWCCRATGLDGVRRCEVTGTGRADWVLMQRIIRAAPRNEPRSKKVIRRLPTARLPSRDGVEPNQTSVGRRRSREKRRGAFFARSIRAAARPRSVPLRRRAAAGARLRPPSELIHSRGMPFSLILQLTSVVALSALGTMLVAVGALGSGGLCLAGAAWWFWRLYRTDD